MKAFRFGLEKALGWRRQQLEIAEICYRQQAAVIASLDHQRAEAEAAGIRAEIEVRRRTSVEGGELAALDHFRLRVKSDEAQIAQKRAEAVRVLAEREASMMAARRRAKLLERLRERRREEWETQRDRELEEIANEAFLAQWTGRRDR
jgi:hypothetical protein